MYIPAINPVAWQLGGVSIHWYGLMYLLSFSLVWLLARRRIRSPANRDLKLTGEIIDDLIFWGIIGVVAGGRIGYVLFYGWQQLLDQPLWLFAIWDGGMSFHGGMIGVLCTVAVRIKMAYPQISPARVLDFFAPLIPIGLGLGRLGNFINQELWGTVSQLPWAVIYERDPLQLPRHPSQLYEFLLEGVVLFVLLNLYARRPHRPFAVCGVFALGYGIMRFAVEFVRQPDAPLFLSLLTRGQLLCLPMIAIGAWLAVRGNRIPDSTPTDTKALK